MTQVNSESPKRSKPPRRRQAEILEAAAVVFREKGYESTSIQDIAEAVGILKGSLYYYFNSKEELLYEILRKVHDDALKNAERTQAFEGTALEKIREFVASHVRFNAENLVKMGVFFHDFRSLNDEHRQAIITERDTYERYLRTLITNGHAEGTVCPDIDPKLATLALLGMMNWIYQWYQPGGELTHADVADAYADFAIAGLRCDPVTHTPGHRAVAGARMAVPTA